jgi:4'-phosphopantetheinyl transferase
LREDFASQEIAESFFSPGEIAVLCALPQDQQAVAFFNCWTRKEAYIKARGEGLSYPLHRFTVSLVPGERACLLSVDDDPQEAYRWSLVELSPGTGYIAALALEGRAPTLKCCQWDQPFSKIYPQEWRCYVEDG